MIDIVILISLLRVKYRQSSILNQKLNGMLITAIKFFSQFNSNFQLVISIKFGFLHITLYLITTIFGKYIFYDN